MAGWIEGVKDFGQLTLRLLQCDLARHSPWFAICLREGRGREATRAKTNLAEAIRQKLVAMGFDRVFWRGDGGVYAAKQEGTSGDKLVTGALAVRETFQTWQSEQEFGNLNLGQLAIRLSCHSCNVWIGQNPEYWTSDDLNLFVKHERDISHENTLAITESVFQDLEEFRDRFADYSHAVAVGNPKPQEWIVRYDKDVTPKDDLETTSEWFRKEFPAQVTTDAILAAESQRFAMGEAIVLQVSPSPEDSVTVDFEEVDAVEFGSLEDLPTWKDEEQRVLNDLRQADDPRKRVDTEKASPVALRLPITDFPIAKISYFPVRYSKARSFLTVLAKDKTLWGDSRVRRPITTQKRQNALAC